MYPSPYIRFKSPRIEREWFAGSDSSDHSSKLHPALYNIILAAAHWYYNRTGEPAILTHIIRSRAEQLKIYPDKPDHRSVHEFGRGVDIRTTILQPVVAMEWVEWIDKAFEYQSSRLDLHTAIIHAVGDYGEHLHIQVGPLEPSPHIPDSFITA